MHSAPIFRRLAVAAMALVFAAMGLLHQGPAAAGQTRSDPSEAEIDLFRAVMWIVKRDYVESVDDRKLVTQALKGMLSGLDAHSDYLSEAELKEMETTQSGVFGGFGLELTREDGVIKVVSPIDDTPAARGGILAGDVILKVDGALIGQLSLKDAVDRLRGAKGTRVTLTIARAGQEPFDITLTRATIHVKSVKSHLESDHIGYVRISIFSSSTQRELQDALSLLDKEADGHLNALVLDLRDDPGGLLRAAVEVAGDFTEGAVVSTRGRKATRIEMLFAPANDHRRTDIPMVVLINGATASASEIVAGALQDHHRATVLGTRSFGKASVQEIVPITNRGAVRLTIARYYTPSGRSIQGDGITPDVVVEPAKDQQAANSVPMHEAELPGALKNTGDLGPQLAGAAPETESSGSSKPPAAGRRDRQINPKIIGTGEDDQLQAAIALLRTGAPAGAAHR